MRISALVLRNLSKSCVQPVLLWVLVLSGWTWGLSSCLAVEDVAGDPERGKQLFQQRCAKCHGSQGQGVEEHYPDALAGDYAREHLQEIIEQTMPEDDPGACVGQDAADVSAYVYQTFYSATSQRAQQAARIELARLTVSQYRNSIADLMLSLRSDKPSEIEGYGLQASYYNSRRLRDEDQLLQRIDPTIDFDFGEETPEPAEEFKAEQFAIGWEGGLQVERTGLYRLLLHSENGAKVWLNNLETPLIDAWVRSGQVTHKEAEVFLLGGRVYPLKVEFFKNNDDRASISLSWQPPHGIEEVIPKQHLVHGDFPEQFVVTANFAPDDRSLGYERGSSASRPWAESTAEGAVETANAVLECLGDYAPLDEGDDADARHEKLRSFCLRFVEQAFRRPLSDQQRSVYVESYFDEEQDVEQAVKRVMILALTSPRFLYPHLALEPSSEDDYAVASRLAYALWDCPPDSLLLEAAAQGELRSQEQVIRHASRMMQDQRARAKLHNFFRYWLDLDADHDLAKDEERFPGFDARLIVDLERSLEHFVEQVVWKDESDFRQLLCGNSLLLNPRLADFYGGAASGGDFATVELEEPPRAGVLTHPYMLAALAHRQTTSPIHRGVFVLRKILGRALRSPPEAIELLDASLHSHMTTRQRVELQTKPDSCQKCHAMINPLGFALEHYDAVGRYRDSDNSQPVDASGQYHAADGENVRFSSARELAELLVARPETQRAFVQEMFVYLTKQPLWAFGPQAGNALIEGFENSEFHIRDLAIRAATLAALGAVGPDAAGAKGNDGRGVVKVPQ